MPCFGTIGGICRKETKPNTCKDRIKESLHFNLIHTIQLMSTGPLSYPTCFCLVNDGKSLKTGYLYQFFLFTVKL